MAATVTGAGEPTRSFQRLRRPATTGTFFYNREGVFTWPGRNDTPTKHGARNRHHNTQRNPQQAETRAGVDPHEPT